MNYYEDDEQLLAEIDARLDASVTASTDKEHNALQEYHITGIPLAVCAHKYGLPLQELRWWNEPIDLNDDTYNDRVDLFGAYDNPICRMARTIADCVQFPPNTAMLHGIGVISSAIIARFTYERYGKKKPVGLYTVCAQPPSTGKSPVNDGWATAIIDEYQDINKKNLTARMTIQISIDRLERDIKKAKTPGEQRHIAEQILESKEKLQSVSEYVYGITDSTPEALEEIAAKQEGVFTIVSDEAEGVSVLFGNNYGEGTANLGVVLKGWDGSYQNTGRIGRQGHSGQLIGAVAVLAQESTVRAVLQAGRNESGSRGVCERFMILSEPNMIHMIDYSKKRKLPVDIYNEYVRFVKNVVNSGLVNLSLSPESEMFMSKILAGIRPHMADGGKFSSELMRGVIGKAEAQMMKIASVLHVTRNWWPGGSMSHIIEENDMAHAAHIYVQLIKCFMSAAESEGIDGRNPEMQVASKKLKEIINNPRKPRMTIKYSDFSDSLRNTMPFKLIKGLRKHVKNTLLPALQSNYYIVFDEPEGMIIINPRLRE